MQLELQTGKDSISEFTGIMGRMIEEMSKRDFYQFSSCDGWEPAVNLYEGESAFFLCMDLAGMKREDIDVRAADKRLVIRGSRPHPQLDESAGPVSVHMMEIPCGTFRREIPLPLDVDEAAIQARYREGYLWVVMPRSSPRGHGE
jgi:HSP20 family protein